MFYDVFSIFLTIFSSSFFNISYLFFYFAYTF